MSAKKTSFDIEGRVFEYADNFDHHTGFKVRSALGDYQVSWDGSSSFQSLNAALTKNANNALLIDEQVYKRYKDYIHTPSERIFIAQATESFKTLEGITQVLEFLTNLDFTKGDTLVVVGGGIIQDVGAFAAACFKRGISWVYFPSTLLSMCDSCIGAKSSINFHEAKNQLGVFSAPSEIVIIPEFLDSLQEQDIRSGLGEILKLFILAGKQALQQYCSLVRQGKVVSKEAYRELILSALSIKKAVIETDEFDRHYRKALNYGHSLGHAIESLSRYAIPHGVAVILGIAAVNSLSVQKQLLPADEDLRLRQLCLDLLDKNTLNLLSAIPVDQMLNVLKKDKKASGSVLSFIMIERPGKSLFMRLPLNQETLACIVQTLQSLT